MDCADIPHHGETIECGRPVMTVFAAASDEKACVQMLREKAQALDRWLWPS
jgi:predicted ATP-grasp superfamily ATP-dependent carboligase